MYVYEYHFIMTSTETCGVGGSTTVSYLGGFGNKSLSRNRLS